MRIIVGGIVAGLILFAVGMVSGILTANTYMVTPLLWKPMAADWYAKIVVLDIIIGLILAGVYSKINKGLPYKGAKKGLKYGLIVWLVGTVPGMGMTYLTMAVPTILVVAWLLGNLAAYVLAGIAIALVFGKMKK